MFEANGTQNPMQQGDDVIGRKIDDEAQEKTGSMGDMTNFRMLAIIAALFAGFVASEIVGALASNSLSLLGDAAAMSVDVFSYLANMWAERTKLKYGVLDISTRWYLEVYIPTFSLVSLMAFTAWVTTDAINIIISPPHGDDDGSRCAVSLFVCLWKYVD